MSKIQRRHQARQLQQQKHKEHTKALSVFSGANRAPRIAAVVPLTNDVDARTVIDKLNLALEIDAPDGQYTVSIDRFKQSIQYVPVQRELFEALDACRVADYVIFVLSSTEEVDEHGQLLLKTIESQGISNVQTVIYGLDAIEPLKKRTQVASSLKSFITHFFPNQEKLYSLDSAQECVNAVRSLCTSTPKGVRWRDERSWMVIDDVQWSGEGDLEPGTCVLTGVVRGKALKANRLLQVADWGTFKIDRITKDQSQNSRKKKPEEMLSDDATTPDILDQADVADQDDLVEFAPEEILMEDMGDGTISQAPTERKGVLLDNHYYFSEEEEALVGRAKRIPKGTSSYQAAWFLDGMSESGSDWEDEVDKDGNVDMEGAAMPQDGVEGLDTATQRDPTEAAPSEYPQSEMFLDPSPNDEAEQIAAFRASRKNDEKDDLEFPDEIELHPNVLARERLAKYRGLKSLWSSHWETEEDKPYEPENWNRLLQVPNYRAAKSQALREALVGGVQPGTRVHVHLRNVPTHHQSSIKSSQPLTAFSLFRHEYKHTAMNFSITISSEATSPVKSKDELIMQSGPRRYLIRPLFSASGNTPNNVHKFQRYLHPGQNAIATFTGPLAWGSVPALFFRRAPTDENPNAVELVGTGTSGAPSSTRIIAKRVILTGHPYKIHKKLVTIRYMFFNTDDVKWFQALQLWTNRGGSGYINQSL